MGVGVYYTHVVYNCAAESISVKLRRETMTTNGIREKIQEEIHLLAEDQLEDLYKVIHAYRVGIQAKVKKNSLAPAKERQKLLKTVLERMQAHPLMRGAPHLSREQLHERR